MNLHRLLPLTLTVVASLGMACAANAAWTFGDTNGDGIADTSYAGSPALTISGVAAANGGTFVNNSATNYGIGGYAAGAQWSSQTLTYYSGGGLGMSSDGSAAPNHAIDNGPTNASGTPTGIGNTEAVLLNFGSSVVLSGIGLGYISGDADVSVFRYTGTTPPSMTATGASLASMTAAGWDLVGNYANLVQDTTTPYANTINASNKGSSWWLISAFNTSYGSGSGLDQGNDYFKIFGVDGSICSGGNCGGSAGTVPEPTSLALAATALVGAIGVRRRRRR